MAKKVTIHTGGPAYMASYTDMMMALLAFFILLNTLTHPKQASGFKAGVGEVKNALGIKGGIGVSDQIFQGKGGANAPNSEKKEKDPGDLIGFDKELIENMGESGTTNVNAEDKKKDKFFKVKIPYQFEENDFQISIGFSEYLKKMGLAFALNNFNIKVKYFSNSKNLSEDENRQLSIRRTIYIMKKLEKYNLKLSSGIYKKDNLVFLDDAYFKKRILKKKKKKITAWGPKQKKEMEAERLKNEIEEQKRIDKLKKEEKKIPNQLGYFYITLN